ncbi:MAG: hypothetical protein C9356_17880 [Oleiphilus sp.]|nr:MAG: hypothetical protein C9356_17880 [Oleiphilus sp.]
MPRSNNVTMNRSEASQYINNEFSAACIALFEGFQCKVEPIEADEADLDNAIAASIDAGSEELEIRALLRMPFSVLSLTYPSADITVVEDTKLEDWMAEIANLLIGKLKTRLLNQGIKITIGLPENFFGDEFESLIPPGAEEFVYGFDLDGVPIECRLYLELMADELTIEAEGDDDVEEGELEMF